MQTPELSPTLRRQSVVFRLEAVEAVVTSSLTITCNAEQVAPNVLAIAHWERILEGEL